MKEPLREKAAFERHPEYFEITDGVIEQVHKWVDVEGLAALDSALSFVKTTIIVRAFNMYRSINLLMLRTSEIKCGAKACLRDVLFGIVHFLSRGTSAALAL